jgi:hypothetical protein
MVILFAEVEYLIPAKPMKVNTTKVEKYFGQAVPVYLLKQKSFINQVALMLIFLRIWKKLIYAGE